MIQPNPVGIGSAALALILTFLMPVSRHRVNQTLISTLIVFLFFVAGFEMFQIPLAVVAGLVPSALAIIYRDILRWIKTALWHNAFRYTHRYYWYNRVGRAILGGGSRSRRRKS